MTNIKKLTMTLVALFAISTGAWAQTKVRYAIGPQDPNFTSGQTVEVKDGNHVVATITYGESGGNNFIKLAGQNFDGYTYCTEGNGTNGDKTGGTFYTIVPVYDGTIDVAVILNANKAFYILEDGEALEGYNGITVATKTSTKYTFDVSAGKSYKFYAAGTKLSFFGFDYTYGTANAAAEGTALTPDDTRKIWTLDAMPAGDVELQVEYFADAALVDGTDVAPAAPADPIYVSTDAALITVPENNAVSQGTLMYLAQISTADAPTTTDAFSATVPTASAITEPGTYHVYYYIVGDDEHSNSAILGPVEVEVLTDKYDITFQPANANTIQSGKATVKVGDAQKTLDEEGKLKQVQMGQTVTIEAAQGYKFRKVEVKKTGSAVLAPALENGATVVIAFNYGGANTCTFTNNNGTFTLTSGTGSIGGNGNSAKQLTIENGNIVFKANYYSPIDNDWDSAGFQVTFDPTANSYAVWKSGIANSNGGAFTSITVNGTDITDQLSELK